MIDGLDISITIMTIALLQLIRANCGWFACGATSRPVLCCYVLCVMLPLSMPTARPTRPINAHKLHDCLPAESFHNVRLRIVDGAVWYGVEMWCSGGLIWDGNIHGVVAARWHSCINLREMGPQARARGTTQRFRGGDLALSCHPVCCSVVKHGIMHSTGHSMSKHCIVDDATPCYSMAKHCINAKLIELDVEVLGSLL